MGLRVGAPTDLICPNRYSRAVVFQRDQEVPCGLNRFSCLVGAFQCNAHRSNQRFDRCLRREVPIPPVSQWYRLVQGPSRVRREQPGKEAGTPAVEATVRTRSRQKRIWMCRMQQRLIDRQARAVGCIAPVQVDGPLGAITIAFLRLDGESQALIRQFFSDPELAPAVIFLPASNLRAMEAI